MKWNGIVYFGCQVLIFIIGCVSLLGHRTPPPPPFSSGWETKKKRIPGQDWCLVKLGLPGLLHGLVLDTRYDDHYNDDDKDDDNDDDTSYITGNYAPWASVQAAKSDEMSHW